MKVTKKSKINNSEIVGKVKSQIAKNVNPKNKQQKLIENASSKPTIAQKKEKKNKDDKKHVQVIEQVKEIKKPDNEEEAEQKAKTDKKKAKKLVQKLKKEERNKQKQGNNNAGQKLATPAKSQKNMPYRSDKEHPSKDPNTEAATVFIGNLPVTTKRVQIVKLFAKLGGVKSIRLRTAGGQIIFKHKQRKQAGSLNAYVVLSSAEAAQKALELNGIDFKGNHLRVTPSDPAKSRKKDDAKRTVFVGNLKYTANEEKLREIFSNCGEIEYIRCLYDGQSKCKGIAYVCFQAPEAVGLALELNETLLDDRPIHVERYSPKKQGAKAARDKETNASQKNNLKITGAKKRINAKNKDKSSNGDSNEFKEKKKSEFRGVKVSGIKKKNKKKMTNEMKTIAKKIAPKIKSANN